MGQLNTRIMIIGLLFAMTILFHSCKVYHHKPSTLKEAVENEKRVKIKTTDGDILKFKKVELINGEFYGLSKVKGDIVKMPIDARKIEVIRLQNKTMSTVYTIGIGVATLGIVGIIAVFDAIDDIPIF